MICDSPLARAFWEHGRCQSCPVIDVHGHMGPWAGIYFPRAQPEQMIRTMDAAGVRTVVNLDGGSGEQLTQTLSALDEAHPGRFLTFALLNYSGIDDDDWGRREAKRLEESFRAGAKGLKIHKTKFARLTPKRLPIFEKRVTWLKRYRWRWSV